MLVLTNPIDAHIHLREGAILGAVAPFCARFFAAAVVMPNLKTPIDSAALAMDYKRAVCAAAADNSGAGFEPLMTLYLTSRVTAGELKKAAVSGVKIIKLYPKGATTNSQNGVESVLDSYLLGLFETAQNLGMMLSIHGETNGFCLEREFEFLGIFEELAKSFPRLKIIIEHMSDRRSLALLEKYQNLFGTLTLHHITMSLDDVLGGALNAHAFCKPLLKTPRDRDALLEAALSAHPKISFGSDSAPHIESAKLNNGAAGIFSAPILLPALAELFHRHKKLENLQKFISDNAVKNYNLKLGFEKKITLEMGEFIAPESVAVGDSKIIPLWAGKKFGFRVRA